MEEMEKIEIEQEFNEMLKRLRKVFANELGYQNARKYIKGLLGSA